MKKTLFLSAILATALCSSAFAGTWDGGNTGGITTDWANISVNQGYYCNNNIQGVSINDASNNAIGITPEVDSTTAQIDAVNVKNGAQVYVLTSQWGDYDRVFASLTIDSLNYGSDSAKGGLSVLAYTGKAADSMTVKVGAVTGALSGVTNSGNLTLGTADQTIKMAGTIENKGKLTLYGTLAYDLSDLSGYQVSSHSITREDMQSNGFADSYSNTYYALKSSPVVSGSVIFSGIEGEGITSKGWSSNNYIFTKAFDASTVYMVNTGTVNNADVTGANRFVVGAGSTLSVTANGSAVIEGAGTVSVTKVASTSRVTGDSMRGLTLDADNWTGWVSLTGTGVSGTGFSTLGSNIEIGANGYEGWDSEKWNGTSAQNYRLTGNWKNGAMSSTSTPTGTFSGTWTGAGNFTVDIADAKTMNYTYSGNIAGWTGNFIGGAGTTLLTLSGNATTMNAAVESGTGTLNMKIATGSLTTLNGAITVKDLTLAQSSAFNEALTVKGNISQNGQHSLRIFNAADITGSVNMTNMSTFTNKTVTLRGGATIGTTMYIGGANADVKFTGDEKTYSFQNLSTSYLTATGAESGTDAVDRKVTVGAGATVNISQNINMGWGLTKVELEDGATLMAGGAINYGSSATNCISSVVMGADSTFQVGSTHNGTVKTNSLTLNGNATLNANLVMNSGTLSITAGNTLTMGCSVTIGDTVEVHISGADAEAIRHGSELTIINLGQLAATDVITLGSASIFIDDVEQNDFSLMRVDDADGASRIVVAPEPATATLSLLALAALAARRKRH